MPMLIPPRIVISVVFKITYFYYHKIGLYFKLIMY